MSLGIMKVSVASDYAIVIITITCFKENSENLDGHQGSLNDSTTGNLYILLSKYYC